MSDLRKAAEMALEALETLWDILDDIDTTSDIAKENDAWYRKRVEFLQKKRWDTSITTDGYKLKGGVIEALRQALAQPEQEPVAWLYQTAYGDKFIHKKEQAAFHEPNGTFTPLYTAPPKREWVGYTNEDREKIVPMLVQSLRSHDDKTLAGLLNAILIDVEQQLKEKNNG